MSDRNETHKSVAESPEDGWLERVFARLGRMISKRPGLVLLVLLASLVPAGYFAGQIEVKSSFLELLPEDEKPVQQLQTVLQHSRSASDITVAIGTQDRALAERFARALADEFGKAPEISGVGGYINYPWFRDHRLLFVPEAELADMVERTRSAIDRELLGKSGLFVDLESGFEGDGAEQAESPQQLLAKIDESENRIPHQEWIVTSDGRYLCLWAFFSGNTGDLAFGRNAIAKVNSIVDGLRDGVRFPRDIEVRYAGGILTRVEDERSFVADLQVAGPVGFLGVILLIVFSLRAPRALVLMSVPLLIGLVWTFAFARLAIGHLNIISGFLFSILSGLGIEYGIHLMHRYRELRAEGQDLGDAIEHLLSKTGRALVSGSLTNSSVFAVIALAKFRGFSEFGLIAAVGLLLTLVATLTGLPALLVLSERWRPLATKIEDGTAAKPVRVPRFARWAILLGVPLFALVSGYAVANEKVRFDGNWRLLAGNSEATQFSDYLRHHFTGLYTGGLIWARNDVDLAKVVQTIDDIRTARTARGQHFDVAEVNTLHSAFPPTALQERRIALAQQLGQELRRIPPDMLNEEQRTQLAEGLRLIEGTTLVQVSELPYSVVGPFITQDGEGSIVHLRMRETDDPSTDVLVDWAKQSREIVALLEARNIDAPLLSENWIAGEIFERVVRDSRFVLFGALLAVFVVLLLDFRRPLIALGVLGSVLLGVLSIAGGMWIFGQQLNFMSAAILPVCVGISLDNAIHVYHRWREGGRGSIPIVLRETTAANALASATNLLGFAALALTHHAGLRSVAYFATIGVAATYVSTTLWFPMLFQTLDQRNEAKRDTSTNPSSDATNEKAPHGEAL